MIDRVRAAWGSVRASAEIAVGRPVTAPAGGMAPLLSEAFGITSYAMSDPLAYFAAGGVLSRDLALSVPTVRRGVRVITGAVAQMPLTRWRGMTLLPSGDYLEQPEADRTYATTMSLTVEDLICGPYAWWYVQERDFQGFPRVVSRLEPEFVSVERSPDTGGVVAEWATYKGNPINPDRLIRFDAPDAGILRLGVLEILTALRLEMSAQTYANPSVPTGYLKNTGGYPMDQEEVDALGERWDIARRTRTTGVLNHNVDYVPVLAMPDQLQLVQGREESAKQIARLLNIPARYVGAASGDSMTYSTVASERRDLYDLTLKPIMDAIEQRLSMWDRNGSPRGQKIRFDPAGFLRSDAKESAEIGKLLIDSGQSTPDEQRALRGLAPLTTEVTPDADAA